MGDCAVLLRLLVRVLLVLLVSVPHISGLPVAVTSCSKSYRGVTCGFRGRMENFIFKKNNSIYRMELDTIYLMGLVPMYLNF